VPRRNLQFQPQRAWDLLAPRRVAKKPKPNLLPVPRQQRLILVSRCCRRGKVEKRWSLFRQISCRQHRLKTCGQIWASGPERLREALPHAKWNLLDIIDARIVAGQLSLLDIFRLIVADRACCEVVNARSNARKLFPRCSRPARAYSSASNQLRLVRSHDFYLFSRNP
jgi:hypothetical protein